MNRNLIKKTPGMVVIDQAGANVPLFSSSGISVELMEETVVLTDNRSGSHDEVSIGRMVQVKMTPTQFTADALSAIFTHGSKAKGASILAATDKTLDIHTIDGFRRRIPNAFVYGEPAMTCKTGSTILGEVTWYGIVPLDGDPAVLANFYNKTEVAFDPSGWDPENDEITPGWNFGWLKDGAAASAWDAIDSVGGVTVTPRSTLDEDKSDRDGLLNVTIRDYTVEVKAAVQNISEDLILAALGWGQKLGSKRSSLARDIVLNATTENAFIRAYNAVLQPPANFSMDAGRTVVRDLTWITRPRPAAGLLGPHLLVSTTDPDAEE